MYEKKLKVSSGINFLSEWTDVKGRSFFLPNGILDKGRAGCGATTLALEDGHKTIICSPRNNLIENKHAQYSDSTMLVVGGVTEEDIRRYLSVAEIPKILVSYDSMPKVASCIENKQEWRVVVDEFQYLLSDSSFKSEVEKQLLEVVSKFSFVTYLSATPISSEYLTHFDLLRDVRIFRLQWEEKEKPSVVRIKTNYPLQAAARIVKCYQECNYPSMEVAGETVYSTECVIFLNSVKNIISLIKTCKLSPEEVNIIVGTSEDNDNEIAKLGEGFRRGRVPLKGEPHKKFTFCTSTAFAGCDFYSTTASTFVVCDPQRVNTTVDIATDLVQIAGRQRLAENPFRNYVTLIYKTGDFERTEEEFREDMERRKKLTRLEIDDIIATEDPQLRKKKIHNIEKLQKMCNFSETFTMIDSQTHQPIFNNYAYVNQLYVYHLQKHIYQNGTTVRQQLLDSGFSLYGNQVYTAEDDYLMQLEQMASIASFKVRMKHYCEMRDSQNIFTFTLAQNQLEHQYPELRLFYDELGTERIRSLDYQERKLQAEVYARHMKAKLTEEFRKLFPVGTSHTTTEIKEKMNAVYRQFGVKQTATTSALEKTYKIKTQRTRPTAPDGKREDLHKIIEHLD